MNCTVSRSKGNNGNSFSKTKILPYSNNSKKISSCYRTNQTAPKKICFCNDHFFGFFIKDKKYQ